MELFLGVVGLAALLLVWGFAAKRGPLAWAGGGAALAIALLAGLSFGILVLPLALVALGGAWTLDRRAVGPALAATAVVLGFALVVLGDLGLALRDPCMEVIWTDVSYVSGSTTTSPTEGCSRGGTRYASILTTSTLGAAALVALAPPFLATRRWALALAIAAGLLGALAVATVQVDRDGILMGAPIVAGAILTGLASWRARGPRG